VHCPSTTGTGLDIYLMRYYEYDLFDFSNASALSKVPQLIFSYNMHKHTPKLDKEINMLVKTGRETSNINKYTQFK